MTQTSNSQYLVILYYQYAPIKDPQTFRDQHFKYCESIGLLGRIIVAQEGINGTLSGPEEQIHKYMDQLKQDPRFCNTVFKMETVEAHVFPRLSIKVKPELVNLSLQENVDLTKDKGAYLAPQEFLQALQEKDTLILDARNDYEYDLGHFRNAVNPNIRHFRDLPNWVKQNTHLLKDKKIVTYCTGGVRCEKFSTFLKKEGFDDVYQLEGGIISYGKHPETQGALWDGQMYVFDQRIAVPVNQKEHVIVGKDYFDGTPCERYINCSNPQCNKQILCHEYNEHKYLGACSDKCSNHPQNRYLKKHNNPNS
ncbi:MAG: rhodanese-related sulfurtransferase [Candidatus Phytoplasma asteris]|uniref:tRNA uridine(34) hydroxylase n=2 Tax=16SrI (Aster yellows group) TaxID=3042590 RepID=TRHO_ONYPE|nr:rhodanese-related sulfurtransferase ['Chrysanthemum coronarium' phytoplasma]Q6YRD0.2 RecName: Full=tRNA uridine(34) hydroxylase; AltName: Full=tRNA hydroxylation protein O [Onion yellows phytoplasma OY-M]TKA87714.1 MAG: rhodanese-related sulfurtransferase [Periwinkle leaf yellowing phytoplasma]WEX20078.1 MAG: rhodanese-related sulfurtransferase [Candidatus Phytoplasma asteris]GAK73541.1 predicted sulfurtransferase ['Chrysanthemum coronarium' phytoplasma]